MPKEEGAVTERPKPRMVMVETRLPGDGNNDVLRKMVPADTDPEDVPENSKLLSREETSGILKRQTAPELIRPGDKVRLKQEVTHDTIEHSDQGYVDAILKRTLPDDTKVKYVRVKWEKSNKTQREDPRNLRKIW